MTKRITSFEMIEQNLISENKKPRTALVAPSDMKILQAVVKAFKNNIIEPILIGDEQLLIKKSQANNIDISNIEIIDFQEPYRAVEVASKMAISGEIDLIIKGKYHPVDFIQKLLIDNREFCDIQKVHHIALLLSNQYKKFLFLSDSFIHCQPDLNIKKEILNSTVNLAKKFGITIPKVAMLAAVEVVYKQMPFTVEANEIQKMYEDQDDNFIIEGPVSFDIALNKEAADAKGLTESKVAGDTDIMIAPNIETANGVYKVLSLFSESEIGGVVVGGKVPVVMPIEIDSVETRYNSILFGLIASHISS